MRLRLIILSVLLSTNAALGSSIVPKPVSETPKEGIYVITPSTIISYGSAELLPLAQYLAGYLDPALQHPVRIEARNVKRNALRLEIRNARSLPAEGYRLSVTPRGIRIVGRDYGGVFNGIQTLMQLLPPSVYAKKASVEPLAVGCVEIEDYPRFAYRGMMLDVARTFVDAEAVKRYIDQLAYHKINRLHWHLTDDEGWRVEIKSHPELAQIGGFRGGDSPVLPIYGKWDEKWGGYYTQDEIRDVVAYAAVRNIEVIPEVDLPGHSRAIARVHPEILCNYTPDTEASNGYDRRSAWCASKESNYRFLAEILGELCKLFPSKHFHVGGDEVVMDQWLSCPDCQALMKEHGMSDGHDIEDYFMARMERILAENGKSPAVWNEAIKGGDLPLSTRVYGWENVKACLESTAKGYPTVVMPGFYFYFDMRQSPDEPGHNWANIFDAMVTYSFDFDKQGFTPEHMKNVVGVQASFFSEAYVAHNPERPDYLEYMTFPRLCALSEIAWTPAELRDSTDFYTRITGDHGRRMEGMEIHYRLFPPAVEYADGRIVVRSAGENEQIRFTNDGRTVPSRTSALYTGPIATSHPRDYRFRAFNSTGQSPVALADPEAFNATVTPSFRLTTSFQAAPKSSFEVVEKYRTFARTDRTCRVGDWVLFTFDEPVDCRSIDLITGFWELPAYQMAGYVEISYDGEQFERIADLEEGRGMIYPACPVKAVRLVSTADGNGQTAVFIHYPRIKPRD